MRRLRKNYKSIKNWPLRSAVLRICRNGQERRSCIKNSCCLHRNTIHMHKRKCYTPYFFIKNQNSEIDKLSSLLLYGLIQNVPLCKLQMMVCQFKAFTEKSTLQPMGQTCGWYRKVFIKKQVLALRTPLSKALFLAPDKEPAALLGPRPEQFL